MALLINRGIVLACINVLLAANETKAMLAPKLAEGEPKENDRVKIINAKGARFARMGELLCSEGEEKPEALPKDQTGKVFLLDDFTNTLFFEVDEDKESRNEELERIWMLSKDDWVPENFELIEKAPRLSAEEEEELKTKRKTDIDLMLMEVLEKEGHKPEDIYPYDKKRSDKLVELYKKKKEKRNQ